MIYRALESSVEDLSEYTERIYAHLGKEFAAARRFAKAAYLSPRLLSFAVARSSALQDALFVAVRGELAFAQLASRLLRRLPRILGEILTGARMGADGREAARVPRCEEV